MKASRLLILAAAAVLVTGAPALAFHDGGVAACNGCHTMHNSSNGQPMNFNATGTGPGLPVGQGYPALLLFANKSDTCLRCHGNNTASYGVWSADPAAPNVARANRGAGDFVFLQEDNINDGRGGGTNPILGHAAGHSVVSGIKNTVADPVLTTAPGGTFPAAGLACTSCHDPHGTSSYRLLYQDGQRVDTALYTSTIVADGIALSTTVGESATNHNAYRSGYSGWCGTCHGNFHQRSSNLIHPSGEPLGSDIATVYNMYNGTTDCIANPPAGGLPLRQRRHGDRLPASSALRGRRDHHDVHRRAHVQQHGGLHELPPRPRHLGAERGSLGLQHPGHGRGRRQLGLLPDPESVRRRPALAVQQVPLEGRVRPARGLHSVGVRRSSLTPGAQAPGFFCPSARRVPSPALVRMVQMVE